MGMKCLEYLEGVQQILRRIGEMQKEALEQTSELLFSTFQKGGSIYIFGASHAGILAEEMYCRAGGMMVANPVFNPTLMLNTRPFFVTSEMERLEGFGGIILRNSPVRAGDVLLIHSVSGRNSVAIDMAMAARELGATIVAITNLTYSRQLTSRHSSGKKLYELANVVLDNCGEYGDASVAIGASGLKAGPTSTVAGATIINMLAVEFGHRCAQAGIEPPIYESANAQQSDEKRTARLLEQYKGQIHYL